MSLAPLFELSTQFQAKNGRNNTAGFLRVFLAGTDDPAVTYSDYNGTLNTRDIYLDDDGRAVVICDNAKAYRLEVYDANGMLMWTEEPVWCTGSGGGSGSVTDIVSQDGSIVVSDTTVGQVTTYDLAIAPDSSEMLEWVETENTGVGDGTVIPFFVDGTMEVVGGQGLFLQANEMYHVTNSFTVTPVGNGISYDTLNVKLMLDSTELCSRSYDVDNSLNDTVECEFSYDVSTTADGYLYWVVSGASAFSNVDAKMQLHRIYSGVAAVPSTYARKSYVDYGLSSKIDYSALEFNTGSQITGISGSAIGAAGVDPNEFIPWSASGVFQPSGDYVSATDFSACCSAMSGYVSAISSDVSSLSSTVSGLSADMSSYVPVSAIEGNGGQVTGISGSAIRGHEYSGVWPVIVDNTADTISVEDKTLAVDDTMTGYESAGSAIIGVNTANVLSGLTAYQPSGDYAYNSSLSSKLDATASSMFQPSGNYQPSGDYAFNSALTAYQPVSGMTAYAPSGDYADNSALDSKLDASASSDFYPFSGNPSGFLTAHQSLAGYATEGYVDSSVSGKLDATASAQFITSLPPDLAYTSDVASAVSGKLDASASSDFYPMSGNPSGFLTAHQSLAEYATEQYVDSAVSGKLDSSAYNSGDFYSTSNPSGFITGVDLSDYATTAYVDSSVSGKLDASASSDFYSTSNPSGFITGVDLSDYQTVSGMTAYQLSGDYYSATNPSGFITGVDLTPYQLTADMSAYQPSGDYIYASALGTGVI